jgi:hypothetical protein
LYLVLAGVPVLAQSRVRDAGCAGCHQKYVSSYQQTAHHFTSSLASQESILGSFKGSGKSLRILEPGPGNSTPGLRFEMEAVDGSFYQTAIAGIPGHEQSHRTQIDVVTGSGTRGQSYLYWAGDQLFELPVSYWADGKQWINSPGYKDQTANFSRPIYPRCLECHATAIETRSQDALSNHYDRASLVVGIICETCHGPGSEHVAAPFKPILNPAKFSRDRQVDSCALCHGGAQREEVQPAFSYIPGQPLEKYLKPIPVDTTQQPEVHGNQVGLLKRSRCYLASPTMSCSTCHDVHAPEQAAAAYSSRCLSCHQAIACGMAKMLGPKIAENCIDCHMPKQPTNAIVSKTAGKEVRATMRTHWIRVYR